MRIEDLGISRRTTSALQRAGITRVDELPALTARELQGHPKIGPGAIREVEEKLAASGRTLAYDPYAARVCAREGKAVGDAKLTDLWLCDSCAADFEARAFAGTPPEFVAPPLGGYCVNCGEAPDSVRLRQWILCGVCGRVAQSFGKSVIAAKRLLEFWNETIRPATGVELIDVDFPTLNRRDSDTIAAKVASIDFEGRDGRTGDLLLGFEMKTGPGGIGPGSVKPMSEFQLDCSDCDDIATVATRQGVPVYLLHAQVVTVPAPPSRKFEALGYWFADAFAMRDHFKTVRQRPRETRPAAYYDVAMFRPLAAFIEHFTSSELKDLTRRLASEGLPVLYVV